MDESYWYFKRIKLYIYQYFNIYDLSVLRQKNIDFPLLSWKEAKEPFIRISNIPMVSNWKYAVDNALAMEQ